MFLADRADRVRRGGAVEKCLLEHILSLKSKGVKLVLFLGNTFMCEDGECIIGLEWKSSRSDSWPGPKYITIDRPLSADYAYVTC